MTNLGLGYVLTMLVVAIGADEHGEQRPLRPPSLLLGILLVSGVARGGTSTGLTSPSRDPPRFSRGSRSGSASGSRTGRPAKRVPSGRRFLGRRSPSSSPRLAPRGEAERGIDLVFPRRGRQKVESILLFSGYPIGLFRKGRLHPVNEERIVFPRARRPPPSAPRGAGGGGRRDRPPPGRGRGAEILKLREAIPGDDPRDIHWPQTARQGRPIVKERASELGREIVVQLDTARPARAGAGWDASFEEAVREAAGLVLRFLSRGERVRLLCGDQFIPPAMGPLHRSTVLTALALVEAGARAPLPLVLIRRRALPRPGGGLKMARTAKAKPDPALLPFRRERILAVGTLLVLGPVPLAFGDSLQPAVLLGYLAVRGTLLGFVRAGRVPCLADRWLNLAGLAYFALFWFGFRFGGRSLLKTALHILLFTAVLKLASIKRERDFSVALTLAVFLLVASMATSTHASILLFLSAYSAVAWPLFSRWALWRDLAAAPDEWRGDERRGEIPSRRAVASSLAASSLLAVPMFVLLPRLKSLDIEGLPGGDTADTGFSEHMVDTNLYGKLRQSDKVFLRVAVEEGPVSDDPPFLKIRLVAHTRFAGGVWKKPDGHGRVVAMREGARLPLRPPGSGPSESRSTASPSRSPRSGSGSSRIR